MTILAELLARLPNFRRTGPARGVITVGADQVDVDVPEFGTLWLATVATDDAWTSIRRLGGPHPVGLLRQTTTIEASGVVIEATDPALARAWLDELSLDAISAPLATHTLVLDDARVEIHGVGRDDPSALDRLAASLQAAAILATRPSRLARELIAATAHHDRTASADRRGLGDAFQIAIEQRGVTVVLDTIRRLPGERAAAALRTRLQVAIPATAGSALELCARHQSALAALGLVTLHRDQHHLAVLRDGLIVDRDQLDPAVDLLGRIALDQRPKTDLGPYR